MDKNKKKDDDEDEEKSTKKEGMPPWLKGKGKKKGDDEKEQDEGTLPPALQKAIDAKKKGKDKKEALTPKQKELDVDGDGDIEGDDLADLRNKKKKSESYRARESWMEAIKKVAEFSKDKQEDDEVKGKKTMTGGKKAEIDVNPDIEEQGKKKKMNAGYSY